jgi:hypothetical protein
MLTTRVATPDAARACRASSARATSDPDAIRIRSGSASSASSTM